MPVIRQNKVTLKDIVLRVGVSKSAVAKVLGNQSDNRISQNVADRIRETAKNIGYQPNCVAQALRTGRTNLLGLIMPWNVQELMDVAEVTAKKFGYRLMVQFTFSPDVHVEKQSLMAAMDYRMDGVVWMPTPQTDRSQCQEVLKKFQMQHTPVVLLEGYGKVFPGNVVVDFDYEGGYRQAVEHLVSNGYRRLYYLSQPTDLRIPFFKQACERAGVEGCVFSMKSPEDLLPILRNNDKPIALIGENDLEVLTALQKVKELKKDIPGEVGILNIGDILIYGKFRLGDVTSPRITSLVRPFGEMACRAIELVLQMKKSPLTATGHYESLPMSFCVRESTVR